MLLIWLYLIAGILFFLKALYWCIIIDVVLSWLIIFGVQIIIGPLQSITTPLYTMTRKILPTSIGALDLAPLVLLLAIDTLSTIISMMLPNFG